MTRRPRSSTRWSIPLWDIDTLPLTYTNSRWSAFFYRADEKQLRRVLPDCLELEDDVVEFWYVDHNHTMLGPYGEMGVTVAASHKAGDGRTLYAGYYPYMYLTQDAAIDAGRVLGFPKKEAFIRVLEHGGAPDDGYGVYDTQGLPVRLLLVPDDPERVRASTRRPASTTTPTCRPSRSSTATRSTAG